MLGGASPAAKVRLTFAWPNATAPTDTYGKPLAQLSHKDDLLISERTVTTGKAAQQTIPLQVPHTQRKALILSFPRRLSQSLLKTFLKVSGVFV